MSVLSSSPAEVIGAHGETMFTRRVDSVAPEVTNIESNPDLLVGIAERLGIGDFHSTDAMFPGPRNLIRGIGFRCLNGIADPTYLPEDTSETKKAAISDLAGVVWLVDQYFRQWADIAPDAPTEPNVKLFMGKFSGQQPSDTNKHFDFKMLIPSVSFKNYFAGNERYSSVYYPGSYKVPGLLTLVARGLAGNPQPSHPRPLFRRGAKAAHVMPAKAWCMEPWNAYHSGPTDKGARGVQRGILDVSYALNTRLHA